MKIIIAPDSFKESLSASAVADAIERGLRRALPGVECVKLPIADGGEGTVDALINATSGQRISVAVTGPMGTPVQGFFGLLGDGKTAVIEVAAACGLQWVAPEDRDPLLATSYGVGELIKAALDRDVDKIIIGLGGSATNEGGIGMLQALGCRCITAAGKDVPWGAGGLDELADLDLSGLDPRLAQVELLLACDVNNTLLGEQGATAVFGPQKGVTAQTAARIESNLARIATILTSRTGDDIASLRGGGAAGGIGATLQGVLNAEMSSGIDIVLNTLHFDAQVRDADLVITGEGRLDAQTSGGKGPAGVISRAHAHGCPSIALAGSLGSGYEALYELGLISAFSLVPGIISYERALREAAALLESAAFNIASLWQQAASQPLRR
ncbi:glycerate kinase [Enterobacter sp. 10-1]|uniref:glycerate kinase n=1 Tax=Raoultella sp. 10-1 TaxID=2683201 RepID=UPI000BA3A205|nr:MULTISPECIES: glycerate kinase [Enterobacteriaceae]MVT03897.1 glycerate kinase [Raoultella sp. 10-1]PAC11508.1 glycerate kinase [Enterobacter sp. 10-1]